MTASLAEPPCAELTESPALADTCPPFKIHIEMSSSQTPKPLGSQAAPGQRGAPGLKYPTNGKTIYNRPLNRSRTQELSQASFAYLFGEMVSYAQRRVTDIQDLEKRYDPSIALRPLPVLPKQMLIITLDSMSKGIPSGSNFSMCLSGANLLEHNFAPSTSSPCSTSSSMSCGNTSSPDPPMRSRNPTRARTNT